MRHIIQGMWLMMIGASMSIHATNDQNSEEKVPCACSKNKDKKKKDA